MDKNYELAADILEDVRCHIDFDGMNRGRLRGIRDELANKVKALSRCYSTLGPFLDRLCRSFDSRIANANTAELLATVDHGVIMNIYRTESQIPVLVLQLRRDEEKKKREKQKQEEQSLFNFIKEENEKTQS